MIVRTGASWGELESVSRFKPAIFRRHAAAAHGLRCREDDFDFRINVGKKVEARTGRHGNVTQDDIGTFFDDPQFVFCRLACTAMRNVCLAIRFLQLVEPFQLVSRGGAFWIDGQRTVEVLACLRIRFQIQI